MKEFAEFVISDTILVILYLVVGILIQFILVRPVFSYLTRQGNFTIRRLVYTWLGFSLLTGLFFGIILSDLRLGFIDVVESIGIGVLVFMIYYLVNFITYFKLVR